MKTDGGIPFSRAGFTAPEFDSRQLVLPLDIPLENARFMSDTHGRIHHLFLGVHEKAVPHFIKSLMRQMPSDVEYTIVSKGQEQEERFRQHLAENGLSDRNYRFTGLGAMEMVWMRELFAPYETPSGTALRPHNVDWFNEKGFPEILRQDGRFFGVDAAGDYGRLFPTGGYATSNDRTLFVSNVFASESVQQRHVTMDEVRVKLAETSGKNVEVIDLPLGRRGRLLFKPHLDMWFTPLGPVDDGGRERSNVVLVGNPLLGAELLGKLNHEEGDYMLNDVLLKQVVDANGFRKATGMEPTVDYWARLVKETPGIREGLEEYKKSLEARGLEVRWIPYIPLPETAGHPVRAALTYNNVLQENYVSPEGGHVRKVYMPSYGIPTLDSAAAEVYRSLGYDVSMISGFYEYIGGGGSLRCLSQVGARSRYDLSK
ncbi:MAG: hypothetical protein ABIH11_05985 [Candidatus Altiarchaeota archaeon]